MSEGQRARDTQAKDAIILGLLDAIDKDSTINQRHLARELGIALGLTNTYLNRCVRKGLLKVTKAPARRYAYYVTPQGFAEKSRLVAQYLTDSFAFLRRASTEFSDIYATGLAIGAERFLLLGDGDLADVAMLAARKAGVAISGTLPSEGVLRALDLIAPTSYDLAIITASNNAQTIYDAALEVLGADRIKAPAVLRIKPAAVERRPHESTTINTTATP